MSRARNQGAFTDDERGDTLPRPVRHGVRIVVAVLFIAAFVVVILVGKEVPAAVAAYVSDLEPGSLFAASTAAPETSRAYPVDADDLAQSNLVAAEDSRLATLARTGAVADPAKDPTLVLAARPTAYGLDDLIAMGAARRNDASTVTLVRPVFIARGSTLDITAPGQTLRLASAPGGFTSIVNWGGTLVLHGSADAPLTLTSWDEQLNDADILRTDGRAYLRSSEGRVDASWLSVNDLGFWSGRTGGFAVTGSVASPGSGTIGHASFAGAHLGVYLSSTKDVALSDIRVTSSDASGIVVDRDAIGTTVVDSVSADNAEHGIEVRPGFGSLTVTGTTLRDNGGYGIRADGSPLADGANVGGFTVANSTGLTVSADTIVGNRSGGLSVTATSGLRVEGSSFDQNTVGIKAVDSQGVIAHNTLEVRAGNGILLGGSATSVVVEGNAISGEGYSAIGEADGPLDVTGSGNITSGWSARFLLLDWIEAHPLALLWALLLVIPVAGLAFILVRRRRQRKIRDLVESTIIAMARADKARYEADAVAVVPSAAVSADVVPASSVEAGPADSAPHEGEALAGEETPRPVEHPPEREKADTGTVWLIGGPKAVRDGSRIPINSRRNAPAPADAPAPVVSSPPAAVARATGDSHSPSASGSAAAAWNGRFASVEELAVAAVLDGGKPIDSVARTLRLPLGSVAGWVSKARRLRAEAEPRGQAGA